MVSKEGYKKFLSTHGANMLKSATLAPIAIFSVVVATGLGSFISRIDFDIFSNLAAVFGGF